MSNDDDFGSQDLDPQERRDAQTYLDDPSDSDNEPWSPPDRQPRGAEYADVNHETLEQRIAQEQPEQGSDQDDRDDSYLGGDDPDAVPAEEDFLGDPDEADDDQPNPNRSRSAEQSAMHIIADRQRFPEEEDVNGDTDEDYDENDD
ncbi:hypothetical protein [Calidifontibacter terrae]